MTVIHPNSISGIASVTSHSNSLYFYESDHSTKLTLNAHVNGNVTGDITATNGTFSGDVTVGGTLTYDDVTNIDSIGVVTARNSLHVTGGNIGIGTDNPQVDLHLHDSTNTRIQFTDDSVGVAAGDGVIMGLNGDDDFFINNRESSKNLLLFTENTERLRIASDGTVIVGTDTTVNPILRILGTSAHNSFIQFADGDSTNVGQLQYSHSLNALIVAVNGGEKLRISSTGQIGMGKAGQVTPNGNSPLTIQESDSNSETICLRATNSGGNGSQPGIVMKTAAGGHIGGIYCDVNSDYMRISTSGTDRLYISGDGKIGINEATPDAQLHVKGSGNSSGLTFLSEDSSGNNTFWIQDGGRVGVHYYPFAINRDSNDTIPSSTYFYVHSGSPFAIKNNGAVVIGTDTAASNTELTIRAASPHLSLYATPGQDSRLNMGDTDDHDIGMIAYANSDNSMRFTTNGTERLRIGNNGNLDIRSGGSLSVTDSNGNASGQASTTGAINCNLIRPYNNSNSSWNGVYFLSRNAVGGGAKSVGIVESGLRVGSFTSDLSATERIKLGTNGVITADTNTTDGVVANLRNDEVSLQMGVWGAGSSYPRQCTINATRRDNGSYPWLRIAGQDGIHFCSDLNNVRGNLNAYGEWRFGTASGNLISTDHVHSIGNLNFGVTSNLARLMMQERQSNWIAFKDGSSNHYGTISRSGSNVVYGGQSSDYRIKENVVGVSTGIDMVKQLRPVHFNYTADSGFSEEEQSVVEIGFIAHEFAEICPHGVIGEKDAYEILGDCVDDTTGETTQLLVPESEAKDGETWTETSREPKYQQIDFSKAVPVLTAALKEAIAKIETLEAKVAVLEGS